jgi:AcrR family transcriptional regulator
MGQPRFEKSDFLRVAREFAAKHGPAAVTVGTVTARLKAPTGSFYHRFSSRDLLLGELWLETVLSFQASFFAALDSGGGLAAALHTVDWSRKHLDDACLLLLYNRRDFVQGDWPEPLRKGVADHVRRFETALPRVAREIMGGSDADSLRRAQFVLIDAPLAAVKPHLQRREPPPAMVDDLVRATYHAVVGGAAARAKRLVARGSKRRSHTALRKRDK